ncbi:zf-CGNR multi-domain protein [Rhodococcus spelaei]|uniref:Zf-CGNR multi-domain protein n=1 Tax=Rhodococcus spelaei TaxID=2546320 RepID=A0A541B8U5_9NOCA|nr:ABATE domain-containing protein [Rhodococcus spelaei]TQF68755.1 zf-CGNR multi-domain protein [Rhodococcus spelaei]
MTDASTWAVPLRSREGVAFTVVTGAACVDFVYTGGLGDRARWESLHEPADLAAWAGASRLVHGATPPSEIAVTDVEFAAAIELREVLWRSINRLADGERIARADAAALNVYASRPDLAPRLDGGALTFATPIAASQILSTLARDAIALAGGPLRERVRRCAAPDCPLPFVDTSRPGTRRWCAMARCGNRDKARTRRRTEKGDGRSA